MPFPDSLLILNLLTYVPYQGDFLGVTPGWGRTTGTTALSAAVVAMSFISSNTKQALNPKHAFEFFNSQNIKFQSHWYSNFYQTVPIYV